MIPRLYTATKALGPSAGCLRTHTAREYVHLSRTPARTPPELARLMQEWSDNPPRPLALGEFLSFASTLSSESVIASAQYTVSELPRRLIKRIQAFESLPYIVGTNPFISNILNGYRESFQALASHPEVNTLEDNYAFIEKLRRLVGRHSNDIANMAKGFQECTRYMSPSEIAAFIDLTISARIAIRLIAEQHLAISEDFSCKGPKQHLGVVDMQCSPQKMIKVCASYVTELCDGTLGSSPALKLDGDVDTTFAYVPVHLEYILTEVLKNSFRANVERHHALYGGTSRVPIPGITVTIAPSTRLQGQSAYLSLRVRDEGGGIPPENMEKIFSYAFTTAGRNAAKNYDGSDVSGKEEDEGIEGGPYAAQHVGGIAVVDDLAGGDGNLFGEITGKGLQIGLGTIAGLGYGLPMAKIYANYFSGSLQLVSLYGHGTDCFIKLRCLDDGGDLQI